MEETLGRIAEALIGGDSGELNRVVQKALEEGLPGKGILDKGLMPGMDIVGQRMKTGEMFIPEVLRSARAMQAAMGLLGEHLVDEKDRGLGKFVIGTVEGDLHDIGKNLVSMMLGGAGFMVIDLGTSVKADSFVSAVMTHKPLIVGMSALLTTTMPKMEETIEALVEAGIREQVRIIIGGAPVTQEFAEEIGADAYGGNAALAVEKAKALTQ